MENTIFNVYVQMENQEQADRMKKLCVDNKLPIWNNSCAFVRNTFSHNFQINNDEFWLSISADKTQVTESEFIDLLKKHKL